MSELEKLFIELTEENSKHSIEVLELRQEVARLQEQLSLYKGLYNDAYSSDLTDLTIEQLRERILLIHSWVKQHQASVERKNKQYNDFKAEAVEVVEFYGNSDTWLTKYSQHPEYMTIKYDITDDRDSVNSIAGNKARQFLAKIKKD